MRKYIVLITTLFAVLIVTSVVQAANIYPIGLSPGDQFHWAFLTDGTLDATSADINEYNTFVNDEANRTGAITEDWNLQWKVIGGTESVDTRDNINVSAPVYLLDSTQIASGSIDLWDGSLANPLNLTQFLSTNTNATVHTGSRSDGTAWVPDHALGLDGFHVKSGYSGATSSAWITGFSIDRTIPEHYYAISEIQTVVPIPTTILLLGSGLIGLAGFRRKFKKS